MQETWLGQFLRRQFLQRHEGGRCVRIQLFHAGGKYMGVRTWEFGSDSKFDDASVDMIGGEIVETAQEDAANRFGRQRYVLCSYYAGSPQTVAESKPFMRYGGGDDDDEGDVDSEGPTARGLQTQLMRHLEAVHRTSTQGAQQMVAAQSRMLEIAVAKATALEEKHAQTIQVYEALLSERHVRELASKEHELKVRAWGELADKANLLLPVVVNKLAGVRILPEPATAMTEMLGSFMESITPEQFQKLQGVLSPDQFIVVCNLIEERRRQEQERQAQAARAQGNGQSAAA